MVGEDDRLGPVAVAVRSLGGAFGRVPGGRSYKRACDPGNLFANNHDVDPLAARTI